MRNLVPAAALAAVGLLAGWSAASGGARYQGWGPRVGMTRSPDQIHFGMHTDFGRSSEHLRFRPNLEIGLGDAVTLVTLNGEASYLFASAWEDWGPYLGGGIGFNILDRDRGVWGDSESDLGASLLAGIERGIGPGERIFLETKLGLVDSPDLKLAIGWTFY